MKIFITTENNPEQFNECYREVLRFSDESDIIVIDNNSYCNYSHADYIFNETVTIQEIHHKCKELSINEDYVIINSNEKGV